MNYYKDIDDCPIHNWFKIREGDLTYCRVDITHGSVLGDYKAFVSINDHYMRVFGLDKDHLRILEIQAEIIELRCEMIIQDDDFLNNLINRLEDEIVEIMTPNSDLDHHSLTIHLEKWLGFAINEQTTSVRKYYNIIKEFKRSNGKEKDK